MPTFLDLKGQKYGRLIVICRAPNIFKRTRWNCLCDCGKEVIVNAGSLRSGGTKSCGCIGPYGRFSDESLSAKNNLYSTYKIYAKNRNLSFSLKFEEFINLTQERCYYCGIKPSRYLKPSTARKGIFYNGLDRIDNKKGYDIDNVVPCCYHCNIAKSNLTQREFFQWLKKCYIYRNLRDKII